MDSIDKIPYVTLVETTEDEQMIVRKRWSYSASGLREEAIRYHRMRGNTISVYQGRLGQERLSFYVEDGAVYDIDSSGVPATACADIDKFYPVGGNT
jgi:hypothetical protein